MGRYIVARLDGQVLKLSYVAVDIWISELQPFELGPGPQFPCGVCKFGSKHFFEVVPYRRYIVLYWVESPQAVEHVLDP